MESYNLKTASGYINNLLLARGLLRDGKPIEFAHPSKGDGGKEATMAQIINLVHDLILKRDRDQAQREDLVQTLRTLRNESTQTTQKLDRLQTKNDDLARQVSLTQSQERSVKSALRTAESTARTLRDEMARLKTTVQQVRTSCANDIRKRDVQITRLKSHLTVQQRGNKTGLVGASITITPGVTGMGSVAGPREDDIPMVDDPMYSLKQETTEFLTQLSQSLSDENDNLIGLVRNTLATLKDLQGLPESVQLSGEDQQHNISGDVEDDGMVQAFPTSYDALAGDMDSVLDNLRNLLTNPNFVSIDEVEVREQQIVRLRAGWEKMELKWREAVLLMDSWRKRMLSGGDTVNLDDLKIGLGLGVGLETVSGGNDISIVSDEEGEEEEVGSQDMEEIEAMEQELDVHESSFEEPDEAPAVVEPVRQVNNTTDLLNLKLPRETAPLREGYGNPKSPKKVNFTPSAANSAVASPMPSENENGTVDIELVKTSANRPSSPDSELMKIRTQSKLQQESRIPRQSQQQVQTSRKRLSSPHADPSERPRRSPRLSVQDKLDVAQAEAEAAKVADGLKASRKGSSIRPSEKSKAEATEKTNTKTEEPSKPPTKRTTKIGGRIGGAKPRRRKSTLTPEELESLMFAS